MDQKLAKLKMEKFAICLPLEYAGYIIGGVNLAVCINELYNCIVLLITKDEICEKVRKTLKKIDPNYKTDCGLSAAWKTAVGISMICLVGFGIACYMCIKGTKNRDPARFVPLMIFMPIIIFLVLAGMFTGHLPIIQSLITILCTGYTFVALFSVRAYFQDEKDRARSQPCEY